MLPEAAMNTLAYFALGELDAMEIINVTKRSPPPNETNQREIS
jgi:hypothetical protein